MYYVYELVNLMGTVEYVGQTINTEERFKRHVYNSPKYRGRGKFYLRQDIFINVVSFHQTKKEVLDAEENLQIYWGLKTDREKKKLSYTSEVRNKMSNSLKGKKVTNRKSPKTFSEEHKRKLSEAAKKQHLRRSLES